MGEDTISDDPHAPLYLRIAADFRERITTGAIPVGRTLPALSRLCTLYRCSLATAQKAVRVLREEGYVASAPGQGTFVLARDPRGTAREWREVRADLAGARQRMSRAQRVVDVLRQRHGRPHH